MADKIDITRPLRTTSNFEVTNPHNLIYADEEPKEEKKMIDWDKPLEVRRSKEKWYPAQKHAKFFLNEGGSDNYYQVYVLDDYKSVFFNERGKQVFANNEFEIRNVPEEMKIKGWLNVFLEDRNRVGFLYTNKEEADRCAHHDRIACIYIEKEYTEGEGLEDGE